MATTRTAEKETRTTPVAGDQRPRIADGVELIGVYEGSGFKDAPYIARRGDGQVIQLPKLLYTLAECADGSCDLETIAHRVTETFGRKLSPDDVAYLVDEKLRPLGILAAEDGSSPQLQKADPLLALKFRARVVPERLVNAVTSVFYPLYFPPVVLAVVGGVVALDAWLLGFHGVAQSVRQTLYDPAFILMLLGLVIVSAAFHECGHATACRYGGARPGVMGVGLYIVWPAFYTDVTDAYRLGKAGRLRTDLGGVYFNGIFMLGTAAVYFLTGFEPLLLVIVLQNLEILHQFLPFLRMDGYYILSDLTGVPDMFARIKPALKSLIPWREADPRVAELKPWVRVAVTAYVFTLIPILLFMFGMMVVNAPRIFATAWDSLLTQWDKTSAAFGGGAVTTGVVGVVQMVVLLLPAAGIVATFARTGQRAGGAVWARTDGHPLVRGVLVTAAAAAAGFMAFVWWPNGEYRPIQPGERGTLAGAVAQFTHVGGGRPGLTPERQRELGGAPTKRETQKGVAPGGDQGSVPEQTGTTETGSSPTTSTSTETTETSTTETATTETTTTDTTTTPTQTTETTPTPTTTTPTETTPTTTP